MHWILALVVGIFGGLRFGVGGIVLGAFIGILASEVWLLRKRIDRLEKAGSSENEDTVSEEIVFEPPAPEPIPGKQAKQHGEASRRRKGVEEVLRGKKSQIDAFSAALVIMGLISWLKPPTFSPAATWC